MKTMGLATNRIGVVFLANTPPLPRGRDPKNSFAFEAGEVVTTGTAISPPTG